MKVLKFGGTSVASRAAFDSCKVLIEKARATGPVVVVVSAHAGVTNALIELHGAIAMNAEARAWAIVDGIVAKHTGEPVDEIVRELRGVVQSMLSLREASARHRDLLLSFGERLSCHCVAALLGDHAVPFMGGEAGIFTDESWGSAECLREVTRYEVRTRLLPVLASGRLPIVAGFTGVTQHGKTTTLGRGGSDLTATLIGAALDVSEVWLCSDVIGLLEADPRIIKGAAVLNALSHHEAVAMVTLGAKGIHPRAFDPALDAQTPVRVRSSFDAEHPGTLIRAGADEDDEQMIRSFHCVRSISVLGIRPALSGSRQAATPVRILAAIQDAGVEVLVVSKAFGNDEILIGIYRKDVGTAVQRIEGLGTPDEPAPTVELFHDCAIIATVGRRIHLMRGTAARFLGALSRADINVKTMAASTLSITAIIDSEHLSEQAMRAVYAEFRSSPTVA